jgi:hypothetical protein
MKKNLTALCILSAGVLGVGLSACSDSKGFYTIASDETRELPSAPEAQSPEDPEGADDEVLETVQDEPVKPQETPRRDSAPRPPIQTGPMVPSGTGLDEAEVVLDQMIRIGEKIYKIVDQGRPVYNYSLERTNVVPKGMKDWSELQGWLSPVTKRYERKIKNAYGITVVYMRYRIEFTPGGSYNGRGRYLQAISILPEKVEVAWGYTLDVTVSVPAIANAGTSRDPIAAAQVLIDSKISTVLKSGEYSESYFVRGDGMFKAL